MLWKRKLCGIPVYAYLWCRMLELALSHFTIKGEHHHQRFDCQALKLPSAPSFNFADTPSPAVDLI